MDSKRKAAFFKAGILGLGVLVMAAGALVVFTSGADQGTQIRSSFREAPLNPEFIRYMYERIPGQPWGGFTKDGHPLGYVPSPHDTSQFLVDDGRTIDISSLPVTYDLRTKNKLTSVKDQAACGSCWSFATFGSLESFFKPAAVWDFSEQDLIEKSGFDMGECDGGNMFMSAAYLARWAGPGAETSHPYEYYSPTNGIALKKHVQNLIMLADKKNPLDNAKIKDAVMKYGAVAVAFCWYDSAYKSSTYFLLLQRQHQRQRPRRLRRRLGRQLLQDQVRFDSGRQRGLHRQELLGPGLGEGRLFLRLLLRHLLRQAFRYGLH